MSRKKKRSKKNYAKSVKSQISADLFEEKKDPLLNVHRNESDNSILDRYTSEEKYRMRFSEMYDQYYQIPVFKKAIDKLNVKLESYAGTIVPDYFGYRSHIHETYIKRGRDRFEVYSGFDFANPDGTPSENDFDKAIEQGSVMLLPLIYAHREKMIKSHTEDWKPTENDLRDYNILKLLTSILSTDLSYSLDILMNMIDSENIKYLDDDLDRLNNRALVQRFFEAIKKEKNLSVIRFWAEHKI